MGIGNSQYSEFKSYSEKDYNLQKNKQQKPQQKTPRHEPSTQETAGAEEIGPDDLFAIVLTTAECYVESMKQLQTESDTKVKMSNLNNLMRKMHGSISNFTQLQGLYQPSANPKNNSDKQRLSSGAATQPQNEAVTRLPPEVPARPPKTVMKGQNTPDGAGQVDVIAKLKGKEKQYEQNIKEKEQQNALMKQNNQRLHEKATKLEKENQQLLLRLSRIASEKLTENNPAITDLSDPNRPTKLGEIYSELYDDEWTDAFEGLKNTGYTELEIIDILRETLLNAVSFCDRNSKVFITHTKELVHSFFVRDTIQAGGEESSKPSMQKYMTMDLRKGKAMQREISFAEVPFSQLYSKWKPKDGKIDRQKMGKTSIKGPSNIDDKLVNVRKDIALYLLPMVKKAYFRDTWDNDCIPELKPYIKKCLYVGWMMAVQSPPLSLVNTDIKTIDPYFNPEQYKVYTRNGKLMEYVVWPTMLLHEKGPVLCKGVAQGFNLNT